LNEKVFKFEPENTFKVMIYNFRITSPESKNFQLKLEADGEHSFFDLHTIIQKSVGFETHQLASFFIPDQNGRKQKEVSMLDLGLNGGIYYIMQKTKLSDLIQSKARQFIYTFDFINDRSFYIELTGIVMERNLREPFITLKQGEAPVQVLGDDPTVPDSAKLQEEEVLMDFGILEDYTELYGEMEDF
jgi:hypothetical protein